MNITLEDFWAIDDLIRDKWGKKAYQHINYCGLEPFRPLARNDYFCTPLNTLTFATTGGNGVHFGILVDDARHSLNGPVIMTVPMADEKNIILAEDLSEFFSIGYYAGWFALEGLVYDREDTIDWFAHANDQMSEEELRFLDLVKTRLALEPQPLSKKRLEDLKEKFFGRLQINEVDD